MLERIRLYYPCIYPSSKLKRFELLLGRHAMIGAIIAFLYPIVEWCYGITGNWWVAVLLFTAITKVILIPLSLWSQLNSITMVKLMLNLFELETRYYGDRETIEEKQGNSTRSVITIRFSRSFPLQPK